MARTSRLSPAELGLLTSYLQRIAPLAAADLEGLLEIAELRDLQRGEHLLRAGERATQTGVVMQGMLREYFILENGTERTKAFVCASQATGSLADLLSDQPSRASIVAEEPVRLLALRFAPLCAMMERSPNWIRWSVRLLQTAFVGKAEREYELLGMDAEQRYACFETRYPGLETRVAAKHIASYLGITPVHLSRLRRRRMLRARAEQREVSRGECARSRLG